MGEATRSRTEGEVVFESDRRFQIWLYTVSHAQLLLRSVKGEQHATRIDVLFKAVTALDLPVSSTGLTIRRNGERFALTGEGWTGAVTAGTLVHAEDSLEYYDPSPFKDSGLPYGA